MSELDAAERRRLFARLARKGWRRVSDPNFAEPVFLVPWAEVLVEVWRRDGHIHVARELQTGAVWRSVEVAYI